MLALEKWGHGRYKPLVMFAHTVALGAEAAYELCVLGRDPEFRDSLAKIENTEAWLTNYRGQALLVIDPEFGREFFRTVGGQEFGDQMAEWLEGLRRYSIAPADERNCIAIECAAEVREQKFTWSTVFDLAREFDSVIEQVYEAHLQYIKSELNGATGDDAALSLLFEHSMHARFFFLVTLPCWIEFGKSPSELFEKAKSGDFDALCMLLNVDHFCLDDTRILEQFQRHMQSNEVRRQKLLRAMEYKPLKKLKRKAIKVLLAALVYKVFNRVHDFSMEWQKKLWKSEVNHVRARRHELTFPAVKRLFDAVHSDVRENKIEDPDFSGITPDGFALSVKREFPFWSSL